LTAVVLPPLMRMPTRSSRAGLARGKRIRQRTFYKRDERRIAEVKRELRSAW